MQDEELYDWMVVMAAQRAECTLKNGKMGNFRCILPGLKKQKLVPDMYVQNMLVTCYFHHIQVFKTHGHERIQD